LNDVLFFFCEVERGEVSESIRIPLGIGVAVSDIYPRDKVKVELDWVERVGVVVI